MFLVVDCPFNREVCPTLVGKILGSPPSYVIVRRI